MHSLARNTMALVITALVALFAGAPAAAVDCDSDNDGYDRFELPGCPTLSGVDCNDALAIVNPAMAENLDLLYDDDCDGYTYIYQHLNAPMRSGAWWTSANVDWTSNDYAWFRPSLGTAYIQLKDDVDWDNGELHVGLAASFMTTGLSCTVGVGVDGGGITGIGSFSSDGQHDFTYAGTPPYTITDLEILCPSASHPGVRVDYMSLTNAEYYWPPPGDADVIYDGTAFPGGGYTSSVVRNHQVEGELLAAANTGGVAWSYNGGQTWWSINGEQEGSRLEFHDQLAVYDVFASDTGTYWAITGRSGAGALYHTSDGGDSWTDVDSTVMVDPRDHACSTQKAFGGGQLFAHVEILEEYLFYVDHTAGSEGVRAIDPDSLNLCESAGDGLLDGLPANEQVAALDTVVIGDDDYLVVGFKSVVDNGDALYICPIDDTCNSGVTSGCVPVGGTGWDVRDLETSFIDSTRSLVYVADSGRRTTADGTGDCGTHVEGTVHAVALNAGTPVTSNTWDTDAAVDPTPDCKSNPSTDCPAWMVNTDFSSILAAGYGSGEIRTKNIDDLGETELSGLALDDDTGTLLVFIRRSVGQNYETQPLFRADVSTPPVDDATLAWVPLQDYYTSDALREEDPLGTPGNAQERALVVDPEGAWPGSLHPYDDLEIFFPVNGVDGVFAALDAGVTPDVIVNGGLGLMRLPHASGGAPGWDSVYGDTSIDLDEIPWSWSMEPSGDFQGTVVSELAFCDTCAPNGVDADGMAWGASWDLSMQGLYGAPVGASDREPGDWDCHWDTWSAGGRHVDLVEDPAGGATVWAILQVQDEESAPTSQAVMKAEVGATDSHEDVRFCWETTSTYVGDPVAFYTDPLSGDAEWRCDREPEYFDTGGVDSTWAACDPGASNPGQLLTPLSGSDYGNPYGLSVLDDDPDVASVAFRPFLDGATYTTRGGLALFYDAGGDMLLRELAFPGLSACGSLSEDEVFHGGPMVEIDQERSWWNDATDHDLTLYVAITAGTVNVDDDCALLKVEVTPSGETWTAIPIGSNFHPANECSELVAGNIQGLTLAPWADDTVFLYGNTSTDGYFCELDVYDPANPTATQWAWPHDQLRPIRSAAPHPHLVDTIVVGLGGKTSEDCAATACDDLTLYQASRRYIPTAGIYRTQWNAYPGAYLWNPNITGVDFDVDDSGGVHSVRSFWLATSGSGAHEGMVDWTLSP